MTTVLVEQRDFGSIKFERRRLEILDVASLHINAFGVRGMTLTAVARDLSLDTSSVTYYFRKKDDLAYTCLERTLLWMREQAALAARQGNAASAMRAFVNAHLALHRAGYPPDAPRLAILSDMHSMPGERRTALLSLYAEAAGLLRRGLRIPDRARSLIATLVLLATVHWIPSWIANYTDGDGPRVEERLLDILTDGLAVTRDWPSDAASPNEPAGDAQNRFLLAATTLINRDGYHGASVGKIAAELGVSTGSFYHHLDNKDELVLACFERSFALIDRARVIGEDGGGDHGQQLARTFVSLLRLQVEGQSPLLRTSAYQALPPQLRKRMLRRTAQMTNHFAGKIADGVAQGTIRAVDPLIAGHFFVSVVNAAANVRDWPSTGSIDEHTRIFLSILQNGLVAAS